MTETIRTKQPGKYTLRDLAKAIDHSLLRPELTEAEVLEGLELAARYDVASVCCRPCDVPLAVSRLAGTDVAVGTTVGFPHGANLTATKVFEARQAIEQGATELDMVLNIGWLRSGLHEAVQDDIAAVKEAAGDAIIVKVILENAYLDDEQKRAACTLVSNAGADFVKTSTGFAPSGATHDDLRLMRSVAPEGVQVKAAGGIRTLDALLAVLDLGVTRVGATATATILDEFMNQGETKDAPRDDATPLGEY
jgi:deoxyribose-phosphate aldolase